MPPAVAIAGIGAAASIGGAVLGSKAQKKAAKKAAQAQTQTTQANNALAREMYGQNALRLDPYSARGNQAGNVLQEILLGPGFAQQPAQTTGQPPPQTNTLTGSARYTNYPDGMFGGFARWAADQGVEFSPEILQQYGMTAATQGDGVQTNPGWMVPASGGNALSAWDQFKQGSMYQNRLQEGQRAINSGYAARGALQSGAAMQALQEHGQIFASNELANWMQALANQQNTGLSAANALAGVGTNMVSQVSANNNQMGAANANAALMSGQANANMWGGIANGVGMVAGALGSGYTSPYNSGGNALNFNLPTQLPTGWGGW